MKFVRTQLCAAMWLAIAAAGIASCGESPSALCEKESPMQGNVVSATSSDGSAAGMLFLPHEPPIKAGEEVKIVWRVTGKGPLSLRYFDPSGAERRLTFGPAEHLDSNFNRPGDEWGAGSQFDQRGCWHIQLSRTGTTADAWLAVQ